MFESLPLAPHLIQTVHELGYKKLTPIQKKSIPLLLDGKDLIGQSATGSGKTAAFTLPMLQKIVIKPRHLQALILCPTRELCTQVAGEVRKLGRKMEGLRVLIVSGGQPIGPQSFALEQGVHVVVGTPGRVMDHMRRGSVDFHQIKTVVLDEADRMLEMGFQEDMDTILSETPPTRQTVLFSATFPKTIEALSARFQKSAVRVTIEPETQSLTQIRQSVYETEPGQKFEALLEILQAHQPASAVLFCNLKATVIEVARELIKEGISAAALHGDLDQWERDRVMARFRNQSVRYLVATDVAARGIDVSDLDAVINYDLPAQPEIYVHRIGRTGRAGKTGQSFSLATSRERAKIVLIERLTGVKIQVAEVSKTSSPRESESASNETRASMETLRISGGRKDKVRPGDILGALTGEAGGLDAADVGKIEIHDHHAFVAVSASIAREALGRLQNGRIKGRRFRIDWVK